MTSNVALRGFFEQLQERNSTNNMFDNTMQLIDDRKCFLSSTSLTNILVTIANRSIRHSTTLVVIIHKRITTKKVMKEKSAVTNTEMMN